MPMGKTLQTDVNAELGWEPSVTAAHIGVIATDGIVTLIGHRQNFMERAGSTWLLCSISPPARSSAGPCAITRGPS